MRFGEFVSEPVAWTPQKPGQDLVSHGPSSGSSLHAIALLWLKEDRDYRRELEKAGGRKERGARKNETTDSEIFFKK